MRQYIDLAETLTRPSLPGLGAHDREAIIARMVHAVTKGIYWDDHALTKKPELFDYFDASDSMASEWDMEPETPEFDERVEKWAHARFDEVVEKLAAIGHNGGVYDLHRMMFLTVQQMADWGLHPPTSRSFRPIPLGLYWTYAPDEWEFHSVWAKRHHQVGADVAFSARVTATSIDWPTTVLANMDWHQGDEEFEIRLLKGEPVEVYEAKVVETFASNDGSWDQSFKHGQKLAIPSSGFTA